MLSEKKPDPDKKKDDLQDTPDNAVSTAQPAGQTYGGPTAQASGTQAAAVMSHWADGETHNQADSGTGTGNKGQGEEAPLRQQMVNDPRFSEEAKVVQNGAGRIISLQVVGGQTRITIALGHKQGVVPGMTGYIKKGNGMLADFQIDAAEDRVAHAMVDVTPDMLKDHSEVVINPSHMPKSSEAQSDMKARLLNISIVDNKTQIMIGRGSSNGAREGMVGYLIGRDGRTVAKFVIDQAHSTHSTALVDRTYDEVKECDEIVLNPAGH